MELKVLETTRQVVENSRDISINKENIIIFCERVQRVDFTSSKINLFRYKWPDEARVNLILLFNTINFSFWADKGRIKWAIRVGGKEVDGASGLFAALENTARKTSEIFEPDTLADLSKSALREILNGNILIPMFEERLECIHEAGRILERKIKGRFDEVVKRAGRDALKLVSILVSNFPSFNDSSCWNGIIVEFHKRAQLSVKMIHDALKGKELGEFRNLDKLTVFADYKIPQVLRREGILEYSSGLADKIDNYHQIPAGSSEEIEIRANTVWACEYIKEQLKNRYPFITSPDIDSLLWLRGQRISDDNKPYHRTRTIYY